MDQRIQALRWRTFKRVEILMSHELKKFSCELRLDIKVDEDTTIKGEINNLVQVLNNLISNSIESYNGKEGKIDLSVSKNGQELEIVVKDYGCGIPENVKRKLLKEMITTKGKNGTGLGLYMSHSTIKGKFGGTMKVKSEEGKGKEYKLKGFEGAYSKKMSEDKESEICKIAVQIGRAIRLYGPSKN